MAKRKLTFVDLFSGCGGMSLGFRDAGLIPILGVDVLKDAAATYRKNLGAPSFDSGIEVFLDQIRDLMGGRRHINGWPPGLGPTLKSRVDMVVGCPPCQGYSALGKMSRGVEREAQHRKLNGLWEAYVDVIELLRPKAVVTENIPQFLKAPEFSRFTHRLDELGYKHVAGMLDAYNFGVPQHRKRAITIAVADGSEVTLPSPNGLRSNVKQAIGWYSRTPSGQNWHVGRNVTDLSLARYRVIPPGGNRFDLMRERPDLTPPCWLNKPTGTTDVFGRLFWDRPASTIRTEFFKPEKGRYLHPEADRPITPREAATLQSFPPSFDFVGSLASVGRQIGEAVPPLMAKAIAEHTVKLLS